MQALASRLWTPASRHHPGQLSWSLFHAEDLRDDDPDSATGRPSSASGPSRSSQSPSRVIAIQNGSYFSRSRFRATSWADLTEI